MSEEAAGRSSSRTKYSPLRRALILTDEARKSLLINLIEACLPLTPPEQAEYERLTGQNQLQEVTQMVTIYEIRAERRVLLRQLRQNFGELPESVVAHIQALDTEEELNALFDRILAAESLEDMGLAGV